MRGGLWMRWAAGLTAALLLAGGAAWHSGRMAGGAVIHFRLDDATGIEPGTGVNLSGVRAGVVTGMRLDADPSRGGLPRARVDARLTPEAAELVDPEHWEIVVTTSPLPGFKAAVSFLRIDGDALPLLPDGAWRSRSRSAVTTQINQAFDALAAKVRALPGGELPLAGRLDAVLRNIEDITAGAREIDLRAAAASLERAALSGEDVVGRAGAALDKAGVTLSYLNQLLAGLRRNWLFRGVFNKSLEYDDLAPFLLPPEGAAGTAGGEDWE